LSGYSLATFIDDALELKADKSDLDNHTTTTEIEYSLDCLNISATQNTASVMIRAHITDPVFQVTKLNEDDLSLNEVATAYAPPDELSSYTNMTGEDSV
jgi:hypothetical protein